MQWSIKNGEYTASGYGVEISTRFDSPTAPIWWRPTDGCCDGWQWCPYQSSDIDIGRPDDAVKLISTWVD